MPLLREIKVFKKKYISSHQSGGEIEAYSSYTVKSPWYKPYQDPRATPSTGTPSTGTPKEPKPLKHGKLQLTASKGLYGDRLTADKESGNFLDSYTRQIEGGASVQETSRSADAIKLAVDKNNVSVSQAADSYNKASTRIREQGISSDFVLDEYGRVLTQNPENGKVIWVDRDEFFNTRGEVINGVMIKSDGKVDTPDDRYYTPIKNQDFMNLRNENERDQFTTRNTNGTLYFSTKFTKTISNSFGQGEIENIASTAFGGIASNRGTKDENGRWVFDGITQNTKQLEAAKQIFTKSLNNQIVDNILFSQALRQGVFTQTGFQEFKSAAIEDQWKKRVSAKTSVKKGDGGVVGSTRFETLVENSLVQVNYVTEVKVPGGVNVKIETAGGILDPTVAELDAHANDNKSTIIDNTFFPGSTVYSGSIAIGGGYKYPVTSILNIAGTQTITGANIHNLVFGTNHKTGTSAQVAHWAANNLMLDDFAVSATSRLTELVKGKRVLVVDMDEKSKKLLESEDAILKQIKSSSNKGEDYIELVTKLKGVKNAIREAFKKAGYEYKNYLTHKTAISIFNDHNTTEEDAREVSKGFTGEIAAFHNKLNGVDVLFKGLTPQEKINKRDKISSDVSIGNYKSTDWFKALVANKDDKNVKEFKEALSGYDNLLDDAGDERGAFVRLLRLFPYGRLMNGKVGSKSDPVKKASDDKVYRIMQELTREGKYDPTLAGTDLGLDSTGVHVGVDESSLFFEMTVVAPITDVNQYVLIGSRTYAEKRVSEGNKKRFGGSINLLR